MTHIFFVASNLTTYSMALNMKKKLTTRRYFISMQHCSVRHLLIAKKSSLLSSVRVWTINPNVAEHSLKPTTPENIFSTRCRKKLRILICFNHRNKNSAHRSFSKFLNKYYSTILILYPYLFLT